MKKFLSVLGVATALFATTLMAGGSTTLPTTTGWYGGVSASSNNFGYNADNTYGVGLQVGKDVCVAGPFTMSLEARANRTVENDNTVDTYLGLMKPGVDFQIVKVYGLAGYGVTDSANQSGFTDGFVYGGGVSKNLVGNVDVFADYVVNSDFQFCGNEYSYKTFNVGLNYNF
jgi:hypothetical protein